MAEKKTEIQVFDGGVTEEQVKRWKGQHRKVARIEVEDDGEKHVGYFKRPSMEVMAASTKVAKTDEVKAGTILFDGCWLGGSEFMRTDPVLFVPTMAQLNTVLMGAAASLKNV
jgi:hypothetical protein